MNTIVITEARRRVLARADSFVLACEVDQQARRLGPCEPLRREMSRHLVVALAIEEETDPELRKKLWDEYEQYKKDSGT